MPSKPKLSTLPLPLPVEFADRMFLTGPEIAGLTRMSVSTVYAAMADGRIKATSMGRKRVVHVDEVRRIMSEGLSS